MGGDLTGKALVPIVREGDGSYRARVIGEQRIARTAEELDQMQQAISTNGMYPLIVDPDEARSLAEDSAKRDEAFEAALLDELRLWVELADERLAGTETRAYVIPGNDDPWSVDEVLASGTRVDACDEAVRMVGPHEMVSLGYSNRTPWKTPRELDEDEIYSRLKRLVDQLEAPERAIFNIHVPALGEQPRHRLRGRRGPSLRDQGWASPRGRHRQPGGASDHRRDAAAAQPARSHPREQRCDEDRAYGGNQPRLRLR